MISKKKIVFLFKLFFDNTPNLNYFLINDDLSVVLIP